MWECRDEFLLRGGGGGGWGEYETREKRNFFFFKMSESVILTGNGIDKTIDLSPDLE